MENTELARKFLNVAKQIFEYKGLDYKFYVYFNDLCLEHVERNREYYTIAITIDQEFMKYSIATYLYGRKFAYTCKKITWTKVESFKDELTFYLDQVINAELNISNELYTLVTEKRQTYEDYLSEHSTEDKPCT